MQPRRPYLLQRILPMALGMMAVTNGVSAAEWTTGAGVTPAVTYTDNVCLSSENEKGEWIGLLTPDVSITGKGRRANLALQAAVEANSLTDSRLDDLGCAASQAFGDRQQFAPRLKGNADAVLLDDWFFVDAKATADQNEASPFISGGGDSLNRTGNTNTTYRYSVSPYTAHRFKDFADLLLRYTWDDEYNTEDIVGDSDSDTLLFTLGRPPALSPFLWGVEGRYSKVNYSDTAGRSDIVGRENEDNELKSAQLNLGYQINRFWQINGFYGQEWNDFVSADDDIDGDFWDAGLRWTPTARTTIEAGMGDRFFGSTPRFSIEHRHKRSSFTASYEKILTFDRDIRNGSDGSELGPVGDSTTLSNSPILDERFTLGYSYEGRRSSMHVSASHSDQTRAEDDRDSVFRDVSVSTSRNLSKLLSVSARLSWDEVEPKGQRSVLVTKSETWSGNIGAQYQLGQSTNLSFDYQYTDRDSDNFFNTYTENRFTLTLRVNL